MSASVRISRKAAKELEAYLFHRIPETWAYKQLAAALKVSDKKKLARKTRAAAQKSKWKTRKERFSAIRSQVEKRAGGFCEGCGSRLSDFDPGEADHFWGRARAESVDTVWLLDRSCHRNKTAGSPSREFWMEAFGAHCAENGYGAQAARVDRELDSLVSVAAAEELSRRAREALPTVSAGGGNG